jgi:hypothetical protein
MAAKRPTPAANAPAAPSVAVGPIPGRCRTKLSDIASVQREMARLYRAARSRSIPTSEASALCWILSQLARLFEGAAFEQRIAALEAKHGRQES